ncbi:hypothetical protein ATANTOWER_025504 [Ataeniobius toweri]|uniref:Uncharacterized protein n=1 Tax=Ataeniobius toweri TaxID=208326 RepID=A0ABU7B0A6_9TELE|nr:hypothetical protein [Ataeniobius toweri]
MLSYHGFLLFGVGNYLAYREIRSCSAAFLAIVRLPGMYDGICRAINTQTEMLRELNCRLDVILTQDRRQVAVPGLRGEMGEILEKVICQIWLKEPGIWLFGFAIEKHQRDFQGRWKTKSRPDPKQLL